MVSQQEEGHCLEAAAEEVQCVSEITLGGELDAFEVLVVEGFEGDGDQGQGGFSPQSIVKLPNMWQCLHLDLAHCIHIHKQLPQRLEFSHSQLLLQQFNSL